MFARTTLSFMVYAVVFGTASVSAAIFIAPMMLLSFFFSGLVILFSSLSYSTFRMASSKYNNTVLFLNRLLRGLADNIPPSVGIIETVDIRKKRDIVDTEALKKKYTPSVLVQAWGLMWSFMPKKKDAAPSSDKETKVAPVEAPDAFEVDIIGPNAPVVYYEDPEEHHLVNQPAEPANFGELTNDDAARAVTPQENHVGENEHSE